MAILTSTMETFVDITDTRKLSLRITSNVPKVQGENPNVLPHTYDPDWTVASSNPKLTPVLFLEQEALALNAAGLTITWKRKDGITAESALTAGETVAGGILTVNQNKLASSASGMITYICYASYFDPDTKNTVNITDDITFSLLKNAENAKLASISGAQMFKYNSSGAIVGDSQISLTGLVQGVSISKWQYKNTSGVFADYPTTSDNANITGGTLVVKPAHAVFFNNVANIRLSTSDADVSDVISITKLYDGTPGGTGATGPTGPTGAPGVNALNVICGNEAQTIAADSSGNVSPAIDITIPFGGYSGTTRVACTVAPGTLPSGMTLKTNTAATASADGELVLSVANGATLGASATLNGSVDLVFTVSGKAIEKQFSWSKSKTGATGSTGAAGINAVVFSLYAPNGTVFQNQAGTLLIDSTGYDGATQITSGATYQWAKYTSGSWANISGATSKSLTVSGADVVNIQSFRCTMTYKSKTYVDIITMEDKSDPYTSEMLSIGGFTFKNSLGNKAPYIIVRTNNKEVDPLLGTISETAPSSPANGTFWYKIDHTAKTVTLMKYNGTAWVAATEKQLFTYKWYKQDKNGNETSWTKSGKVIYLHSDEVDSMAPVQCNVDDGK